MEDKLDKKTVEKIIQTYADAWINQDPDKIISIFAPGATYHERVLEAPHIGHDQIRAYWESKVVGEQSDIHFKLLNIYVDGMVAIVEWDASFFNKVEQKRIHIQEVAILEIAERKIKSLREYWSSERVI